jgi:hypothetical protein
VKKRANLLDGLLIIDMEPQRLDGDLGAPKSSNVHIRQRRRAVRTICIEDDRVRQEVGRGYESQCTTPPAKTLHAPAEKRAARRRLTQRLTSGLSSGWFEILHRNLEHAPDLEHRYPPGLADYRARRWLQ